MRPPRELEEELQALSQAVAEAQAENRLKEALALQRKMQSPAHGPRSGSPVSPNSPLRDRAAGASPFKLPATSGDWDLQSWVETSSARIRTIEAEVRKEVDTVMRLPLPSGAPLADLEAVAACRIQAVARGTSTRRGIVAQLDEETRLVYSDVCIIAATRIQARWRGNTARQILREQILAEDVYRTKVAVQVQRLTR